MEQYNSSSRLDAGAVVQPPQSIADQIYLFLRKRILTNEILPNQRLMQKDVAEAFNASRTPVREAFRLLEQDNLVERIPQGGVKVTVVDMRTLEEVFAIRAVLEGYAVELACQYIAERELEALRDIERQAQSLLASPRTMEEKFRHLLDLNSRFHDVIYKSTGSRYLMRLINNLKDIVLRMRAMGLREHETWRQVWEEHSQLRDLLARRNAAEASALIKIHIANAADYVTSILQSPAGKYLYSPEEKVEATNGLTAFHPPRTTF